MSTLGGKGSQNRGSYLLIASTNDLKDAVSPLAERVAKTVVRLVISFSYVKFKST
jgi:hypothetical protein